MSFNTNHYGARTDEDIVDVLTAIIVCRGDWHGISQPSDSRVKPRKEENRMSKTKLLLDVVEDVHAVADSLIPVIEKFKNLAESLQTVADALASTETKAEHIVDPKEPKTLPQEIEVESVPSLVQVNAVLADKSRKWAHCRDSRTIHIQAAVSITSALRMDYANCDLPQ